MSQTQLARLIPALRVPVRPKYRKLSNPEGPYGRLKGLRRTVTELVRNERIEMHVERLDEARGYAERLIQDAVRNGDRDAHTMDLANFWLEEKQLVHKLFKVLAPRFADYRSSYTTLHRLPPTYREEGNGAPLGVLELKGSPLPPLKEPAADNRNQLHNVLLDEARRQYRLAKYRRLAVETSSSSPPADQSEKLQFADGATGSADASPEPPKSR